jgi:hypothetical protein
MILREWIIEIGNLDGEGIEMNLRPAAGHTPTRNKEDLIVIAGAGGLMLV